MTGPLGPPSADLLRLLVRSHLLAVPFENLDIAVFGRPIRYELPALVEKIVDRRRGGWCYELNLLFLQLLRGLGFEAELASGRVIRDGVRGPELEHATILVHLEGERWLADVGYGDMLPVLPLRDGAEESCGDRVVRLRAVPDEPSTWAIEREIAGHASRRCTFTTGAHPFEAFLEQSGVQQTSPASVFQRHVMVNKPLPAGGQAVLLDANLLITIGANTTSCPLADPEQVRAALRDGFGIDVGPEEAEAIFARRRPAPSRER